MARRVVTFAVAGVPQPKGSTKAFVPKSWAQAAAAAGTTPRAVVTSDNPRLKEWQTAIADGAQPFTSGGLFVGPVSVAIVFRLKRPASLPRRVLHHLTVPDVDKLARACLDALEGVLFDNDRAVVELRARKVYAPLAAPPGCDITVAQAAPPDPQQSSFDLFAEEAP